MSNRLMDLVEEPYLKPNVTRVRIGDTVDVATRIYEGEKVRVQTFSGVVIARRGRGLNENFTVRRIVGKQGVERIFMVHSPNVVSVTPRRHGKVRRAKLYFLRKRIGKARKLRELRTGRARTPAAKSKSQPEPELVAAG